MSSCAKCGKDLSNFPADITVCPYCSTPIEKVRKCPHCGKDLSTLPNKIVVCPFCGNPLKKKVKGRREGIFLFLGVLLISLTMLLMVMGAFGGPIAVLLLALGVTFILLSFIGQFRRIAEKTVS